MDKLILYSAEDAKILKNYKCYKKAESSNSRFKDKITAGDILEILKRYEFKCFYCGQILKPSKWQLDHFYAKAAGGLNKKDNLVCSCKWCNTMKNALDGYSFLYRCDIIVKNNKIFELFGTLSNCDYDYHPKSTKIKIT